MWVCGCAGRPSRLTCSLALAHPKLAAPVCWRADGTVGGMWRSGRWEMVRGDARMIHADTEGQSGSGKGKGRDRDPNSLLFLRNLCIEVLHKMVLWRAWDGSQVPWGAVAQGTPQSRRVTGSWLPPGRTPGICTDPPCLSLLHVTKDAEPGKGWATPASRPPAGAVGPCGGSIPGGHGRSQEDIVLLPPHAARCPVQHLSSATSPELACIITIHYPNDYIY